VLQPRHIIADVDNLLKPVLDALRGIAWIDDTQVCELMVRRVIGRQRQLRVTLWRAAAEPHAKYAKRLKPQPTSE
jgi:Holliday junction resolvase RusA-like endonuclease